MTADFNWFLNKQGPRGQQGVRGEQGFSPVITVAEDTAKAYILRIQTQDDTFLTPNLRGTVDDLGGTYVRYNPETGQVYAGSPDTATTKTFGVIRLATQQDVTDLAQDAAVTPELLANQIEALDLPNNYVTTNTAQTINALKAFRNGISLSSIHNGDGAEVLNFLSGGPFKFKTWGNGLNVEGGTLSVTDGSIKSKSIKQPSTDTNVYDVVTSFDLATTESAGIVKPDGSTVFIDKNGVISAKSSEIDDANTSAQSTWSSTKINTEISTVAQEVVAVQGNVASLDADVSTLKPIVESHTTSISSINDSIAMAMSDITELKDGKQDKLTAGNNITIEGNVISATGGGGETDAYTKAETDKLLGEKADKFTTSAPLTISEKSDAKYDGTIANGTISFDRANSFTTISDVLYASSHDGDRITKYVALPLDVNTIVKAPIMGNFNNTSEYGQMREQVLLGDFDNNGKFIPYVGILNESRPNNRYGRMNGGATISNINPNGAHGLSFTYTSPSSHNHNAYTLETANSDDAPIESQSIYIEKYIASNGELAMGLWTVGDLTGSTNNMVSTTFDGSMGTELQEACKKSKWVLFFPASNGLTPNIGDFKIYETNGRHGWNKAGLLSGITNAPYKQPLVSSAANIALLVDNSTIKVNDNGQLYAVAQESPAPTNMVTTDTEQTITGLKTFSAGIKGNGYINSIGLTDLIYTDNNKNPHVGNVSRTLTIHTNPIGNGRILVNDGSSNYEDLHTGNIANFIDGTSITFTNNKLSATSGGAAPENMVTTDTAQEITGSKLFSNGLKVGGYAGISDNNGEQFIYVDQSHNGWTIGCQNSGGLFSNVHIKRGASGDYINIDSGNIRDYVPYTITKLTQSEYDALATKDDNTMYIIVG